jgi:hypothetical protein
VLSSDLVQFLNQSRQAHALETLARTFRNGTHWAKQLQGMPGLKRDIAEAKFNEDTFGSFLQRGLRAVEEASAQAPGRLRFSARPVLVVDQAVRDLSPTGIEADIREYQGILSSGGSEETVHTFLAAHSYFFNGILRLFAPSPLYSKVKLGSQHVTDFAWFDSASSGPEWRFAEIEGPRCALFTKSGEPSAHLHHAIQQVRDWHAWIHEHLEYARRLLVHVEYPLGYVFVGRRSELTETSKARLRRLSYENRAHVHIHTLDWFVDAARGVTNLVEKGGGSWPVPMSAFSHADLEAQRPAEAYAWLRRSDLDADPEERMAEREAIWNWRDGEPP